MRMTVPKRLPTSVALSKAASGARPHGCENVLQALADALRGLAPEDLRDSHVGMREAHRGYFPRVTAPLTLKSASPKPAWHSPAVH